MSYIIVSLVFLIIGGAVGFFAGVKNANSSKVAKAKEVIDTIQK